MPNAPLAAGASGDDVAHIQTVLTQLGYQIPASEVTSKTFGPQTQQAVQQYQQKSGLPVSGQVDAATASLIASVASGSATGSPPNPVSPAPAPVAVDEPFTVKGTVSCSSFASLGGLQVEIVDKNVGPDTTLAGATTATDGTYQASFSTALLRRLGKPQPDLQARVYSGKTLVASSDVRYGAVSPTILNVVLPPSVTGLPSEHETLSAAISATYKGSLTTLQESADRQDITYLANKTGWDARAVAMAALAAQFSAASAPPRAATPAPPPAGTAPPVASVPPAAATAPPAANAPPSAAGAATGAPQPPSSIPPEFFYALFRAGFPANADDLYRVDPKTVQAVWTQSIAQGVIPQALSSQMASAVQTFQSLSATKSLTAPASIGLSRLTDILQLSLPNDPVRQQQFANLYTQYQDDLPTFWSTLQTTFGAATAQRLQLDGQLTYLTVNNAALVGKLYQAETQSAISSPLDLANRGYHQPAKWLPLIDAVPAEIPGTTLAEQRNNYAQLLATHIRLAFPTAAVANMVSTGIAPVAGAADLAKSVAQFLTDNQGKFEIGTEPVDAYLARNQLTATVAAPVVTEVKRLQRVYQITPTDQAFTVLLQNKLDSAYAITRYDQAGFVRTFAAAMGGATVAEQTYSKAVQVHGAVVNVATSFLAAQISPPLGSNTGGYVLNTAPQAPSNPSYPITAYPTLQGLLGSLDFCSCDECRSIMGPAAYMVNLLEFIDCLTPQAGFQNPQAVLFGRRPDLQYLPLTCENTNVALPYIDLCNETMEYFVANKLSLVSPDYQGHDTGATITSDELMASPQYVNDAAYATLQTAWFPPPLPFHRPLALLRLHFQKLGEALPEAMAALRPSDAIERGTATYGWRDILMEQLGLSRPEYRILTDSTLKLQDLYGYPSLSDSAVITSLSGLQDFSRRTGVSYLDLASILQTRFINPNCVLIPRLQMLNVPFTTLQALKNGTLSAADFKSLLPSALDATEYGGSSPTDLDAVVTWVTGAANYGHIMGLITITDTSANPDLCSAASLQFRYANPDSAANVLHAIDFVRLIRFIRLWQKLGLSIQQTDDIISALYPAANLPTGNDAQDLTLQDAGFLVLLPRIGFLFQVLDQLQLTAAESVESLLACWAPIGAPTGMSTDQSLYASMFLTATVLKNDPAFADDGYGNLLRDNTQMLLADAHVATLRAAFNLTASEFAAIVSALGFTPTTVLTLASVSAIYRIGWLSRALQISVVEFLLLKEFAGLDPFAPPDPSATAPAEPPVIRFIRLVQAANAQSLQPVQVLYLIWNQDISGLSAPQASLVTGLAATLRADFAAVESQFALVDDPTGSIAKSLMELAYGASATDFFFGLLNNTLTTGVAYGNPQPTLAQPILDAAAGRLSYDDLRKQLTFAGVLDAATQAAVQAAIVANGNYAPLLAALTAISASNHKSVDPFFSMYPELGPGPGTPYAVYVASTDPPQAKRTALLANLMVDLKSKRKQEQALAAITAAAGTDPSFASAMLTDVAVMAASSAGNPAISDLTAIEVQGLSAQFFLTNNLAAAPDQTLDAVPAVNYAAGGTNPLPPGQGGSLIAAIWRGYLSAAQDGDYNIQIAADAGATVTLQIAGVAVAMSQASGVWSNLSEISLVAGALTAIELTVASVKNTVSASWESKGLGWQIIPGTALYPATAISRLRDTYTRFLKGTSLAAALSLTANEIAWLASSSDLAVNGKGWLNSLLSSGNPDAGTSAGLRDVLGALLDYARIKQALSPKDERFLGVLETPAATTTNGASALLTLTGWSADSRDALLQQFFGNAQPANLGHIENFRRVFDAYTVTKNCGISAAALIAATTNDPSAAIVTGLQSALRALYAESDWLSVVQPINNSVRDLQRDALVAYILQQLGDQPATAGVNSPDKLFEYFLMDVEMEPCMQTSRIRHALSSIQLFIERCLRNLEPLVTPSDIDGSRWEVMKRYRLWQANLEVFLWPERWLFPELRDNQSPFFQQTMKTLLQSDMTDDAAATAYLGYLAQLESVAKLEPCAMYYSPADPTAAPGLGDEFAHVIARSCGGTAKYYYRQLIGGSWTPWLDTGLAIENVPLTLCIWNNRLLLLWLNILNQSSVTPPTPDPAPPKADANHPKLSDATQEQLMAGAQASAAKQIGVPMKVPVQAALCWSEFYNGKWQPTKTSDLTRPTLIGAFDAIGPEAFERKNFQIQTGLAPGVGNRLVVSITQSGDTLNSDPPGFLLYNTHSIPPALEDVADNPDRGGINWRAISTKYQNSGGNIDPNVAYPPPASPNTFSIGYTKMVAIPTPRLVQAYSNDILTSPVGERVVVPQQPSAFANAWNMPFFFEDSRNVFYVTTSQAMVPLHRYLGFGVSATSKLPAETSVGIAGLVVPPLAEKAATYLPSVSPSNPPLAQPGDMRRFVSEDAYIRVGLATTTPVTFQGAQIGPRGSLPAVPGTQSS